MVVVGIPTVNNSTRVVIIPQYTDSVEKISPKMLSPSLFGPQSKRILSSIGRASDSDSVYGSSNLSGAMRKICSRSPKEE